MLERRKRNNDEKPDQLVTKIHYFLFHSHLHEQSTLATI